MKNKITATIVFLVIVLALAVSAFLVVPKVFPKNSLSSVMSVSSQAPRAYSLQEMILESDNVLSGTVIKADVDSDGVLYTLTVSWRDVYKGRNYATMGYAYLVGPRTLVIDKTYLFIGDTGEEKYHYYQPFNNAPWVFTINEDKTLTHASNGDMALLKPINDVTVDELKEMCK